MLVQWTEGGGEHRSGELKLPALPVEDQRVTVEGHITVTS